MTESLKDLALRIAELEQNLDKELQFRMENHIKILDLQFTIKSPEKK